MRSRAVAAAMVATFFFSGLAMAQPDQFKIKPLKQPATPNSGMPPAYQPPPEVSFPGNAAKTTIDASTFCAEKDKLISLQQKQIEELEKRINLYKLLVEKLESGCK